MRKIHGITVLILLTIVVVSMMPGTVLADDSNEVYGGGYEEVDSLKKYNASDNIIDSGSVKHAINWILDSDGLLIVSGIGEMEDFESTNPSPWKGNESIKKIIIEDGVLSIGKTAFADCINLTEIKIANTVKDIGSGAFTSCLSLTSIVLPNSVSSIGDHAFQGCSNIINITMPKNIEERGEP